MVRILKDAVNDVILNVLFILLLVMYGNVGLSPKGHDKCNITTCGQDISLLTTFNVGLVYLNQTVKTTISNQCHSGTLIAEQAYTSGKDDKESGIDCRSVLNDHTNHPDKVNKVICSLISVWIRVSKMI
jgi:hypothetical protein